MLLLITCSNLLRDVINFCRNVTESSKFKRAKELPKRPAVNVWDTVLVTQQDDWSRPRPLVGAGRIGVWQQQQPHDPMALTSALTSAADQSELASLCGPLLSPLGLDEYTEQVAATSSELSALDGKLPFDVSKHPHVSPSFAC